MGIFLSFIGESNELLLITGFVERLFEKIFEYVLKTLLDLLLIEGDTIIYGYLFLEV
jgi:hypothetical protein